MTAFNVVRFRVKPGREQEFLDAHQPQNVQSKWGRMKILGLDVDAIGRDFREVFDKVRKNCARCGDREACVIDLRHDPNALTWEAYCPNSDVLNALVALTEAGAPL